ncbi:hypothetical protein IWQ60_003026 [Tieghemiomyces parasiticus]|uniref:G protein-coupled receptor n=1 Tax=Tieghemiomyces parasiticus TaxID=78921 RepID=A0A9W8E129_9FUNG|nr:hypothetical protein IWQ60_003026 [Tieghemiomyces parasiticus]
MNVEAILVALLALGGVSIIASIATMLIVAWVWKIEPQSKESPSFNLTFWIGLADIPVRISDIFSNPMTWPLGFPTSPSFARFYLWLGYFGPFYYIYLNCMIALDLQLIFFHRLPRQARIRAWYPLLGFGLAFFLAFFYLVMPDVELASSGQIIVGKPGSAAKHFVTIWSYMWLDIGVFYTLVVVLMVLIKVIKNYRRLRSLNSDPVSTNMSKAVLQNTLIILAYPLVLFIVYIPYVLANWFSVYLPGDFALNWYLVMNVIFNLQGVLNLIVLMFHPVMLKLYRNRHVVFSSLLSQDSHGTLPSAVGTDDLSTGELKTGFLQANQPRIQGVDAQGGLRIQTLDLGPAVTAHFARALEAGQASASDGQLYSAVDEKERTDPLPAISMPQNSYDDPTFL